MKAKVTGRSPVTKAITELLDFYDMRVGVRVKDAIGSAENATTLIWCLVWRRWC